MTMTTVAVERSATSTATAERAWSLLSGAAAWSLRPGMFAFDVTPVRGQGRFRLAIATRDDLVWLELYDLGQEPAAPAMTLRKVNVRPDSHREWTLSVRPGRRGVTLTASLRGAVPRSRKPDVRTLWRAQLDAWLAECRAVLEDRKPWPDGRMPFAVQAACARRRTLEEPVSVRASAVIAATADRVWQAIWDPATNCRLHPKYQAAGLVPGTPARQPGEMQYVIHQPDGHPLVASLLVVHELAANRRALWQCVTPVEAEMVAELEPDAAGTRLTIEERVPGRLGPLGEDDAARHAAHLARYKEVIEAG